MEKFTKPELLNFLCDILEGDADTIHTNSPTQNSGLGDNFENE